jgi:hypothetical protein
MNEENEVIKHPPQIIPVKIIYGPRRRLVLGSEDVGDGDEEGDGGDNNNSGNNENGKKEKMGGEEEEVIPSAMCCVFHPTQPWIYVGFDDGYLRMYL